MRQLVVRARALPKDAKPIADYGSFANYRDNAIRGSTRLLNAIMRMNRKTEPSLPTRPYRPKSWEARKKNRLEIQRLQEVAAPLVGLTVEDLMRRRGVDPSRRNLVMYLARHLTLASYPDIGKCFGGRDHTTVMANIKMVESRVNADQDFQSEVERLSEQVTRGLDLRLAA